MPWRCWFSSADRGAQGAKVCQGLEGLTFGTMGTLLSSLVALVVLVAAMAGALWTATRLGARLSGIGEFRWFDGAPAGGSLVARAGARCVGVLGPYFVCVALFFVGRLVAGNTLPTTSVKVLDGPAQEAGILTGDRIVAIDGKVIDSWDSLRATVREGGGPHHIEVERAGEK